MRTDKKARLRDRDPPRHRLQQLLCVGTIVEPLILAAVGASIGTAVTLLIFYGFTTSTLGAVNLVEFDKNATVREARKRAIFPLL